MKLIVAFENPNLFHLLNLKKLSLNGQKLIMICPYDFIYYFFSLRNRFLFKPFIFFTNNMKSYLLKNIPNLKLKVEKPNIFHIIYFFPISLIKQLLIYLA